MRNYLHLIILVKLPSKAVGDIHLIQNCFSGHNYQTIYYVYSDLNIAIGSVFLRRISYVCDKWTLSALKDFRA